MSDEQRWGPGDEMSLRAPSTTKVMREFESANPRFFSDRQLSELAIQACYQIEMDLRAELEQLKARVAKLEKSR